MTDLFNVTLLPLILDKYTSYYCVMGL